MKEKKSIFSGLLIAASLLLVIGCGGSGGSSGGLAGYTIGDIGPSGFGKVFYITDGGLHGLEAAPNDLNVDHPWIFNSDIHSQVDETENGNTGTAIGTGLENTMAILAQPGHEGSAAQACRDYDGGGFTDWYLPSKDELNQLYLSLVGGFETGVYWSSSEADSGNAWRQGFNIFNSLQEACPKDGNYRVRAIRAF